ncbi:MAG TPA: hypothetical protein DCM02_09840 [Flavobacterium sp.]|nr:hypothetical protein [Flavobacterium sp.]HAT80886.1 hypothetical protein [Flavobacterium sp.]
MKNFKKLSREELKKTVGGQACRHVIQGADGRWTTRKGTCRQAVEPSESISGMIIDLITSPMYCDTGLGEVAVTSNGGRSRC